MMNILPLIEVKSYELSILTIAIGIGNVLGVVSDLRIAAEEDKEIYYYIAHLNRVTDYYSLAPMGFGMQINRRALCK